MAEQDEVEVKTPAGSIRARGTDIIALLTLIGIVVMAYALWDHRGEAKASQVEVTAALKSLSQSQEELSYLMTLTAEERTKLKLDMPESLRRRTRDR